MKTYKDLTVWQKAMDLCVLIYEITKAFPKEEMYGLTSQLRRNGVSIPSNIAEGQERHYKNEFIQFCRISYGSGAELETQLELAKRVGYLSPKDFEKAYLILEDVMMMLNKLLKSLR